MPKRDRDVRHREMAERRDVRNAGNRFARSLAAPTDTCVGQVMARPATTDRPPLTGHTAQPRDRRSPTAVALRPAPRPTIMLALPAPARVLSARHRLRRNGDRVTAVCGRPRSHQRSPRRAFRDGLSVTGCPSRVSTRRCATRFPPDRPSRHPNPGPSPSGFALHPHRKGVQTRTATGQRQRRSAPSTKTRERPRQ